MTHTRTTLAALLEQHDLGPSRALGQNFVVDPNTVRRIARLAHVDSGDQVIEIGAGLGSLTLALAETGAAVSGAVTRTDSGVASWFKAPSATCAHRTLPMGTVIKVTRIQNGASATCKVDDRGPTVATGRLIDLSLDTFEKLAAREAGLIDVRIEW